MSSLLTSGMRSNPERNNRSHSHSRNLRAKLLEDILADISISNKDLARALTRQRLIASHSSGIGSDFIDNSDSDADFQLFNAIQDRLLNEIEIKISTISNFSRGSSTESVAEGCETLQELVEDIASSKAELEDASSDIREQVARMNELHLQLQSELLEALSSIPPKLIEKRLATNDLLSTTIEVSLIKLSLMRTRLHQTLYGFTSSTDSNPSATMSSALSTAYAKLKDEENDLREEERALDVQLEEYRSLTALVDGNGSSGFRQLVEDWTRVQKEAEECKRDLRRLGWTGN